MAQIAVTGILIIGILVISKLFGDVASLIALLLALVLFRLHKSRFAIFVAAD